MSPSNPAPPEAMSSATTEKTPAAAAAADRRKRKRVKLSAQVHVRGGIGSVEEFQEVCSSVDVSRDGLLFVAGRSGYWVGQPLDVTFPYTPSAGINTSQKAKVARVFLRPDRKYGVAVQFQAAAAHVAKQQTGSSYGSNAMYASYAAQAIRQMVLLVESDMQVVATLSALLQQDGYHFAHVPTAKAALDVLKTAIPVAVIAEVEGVDMNGRDLCVIIKKNERLKKIPVILLTSSASPADYSESHQIGAVVCMAKPFNPERLQHVVRMVAPPPSQRTAYGGRIDSNTVNRTL
jgi:CheY-like chemotaxis protein